MAVPRKVDIVPLPGILDAIDIQQPATLVVADILRATTSICTAFSYGVKEIIPVASLDEALRLKTAGFLLAGERGGRKIESADLGNSPFEFMDDRIMNSKIVFTTTNGTRAIRKAASFGRTVAGSFSNFSKLAEFLRDCEEHLVIVCSGWNGRLSLEDLYFAGSLLHELEKTYFQGAASDEVGLAKFLAMSENDSIIRMCSHAARLMNMGFGDDVRYCFRKDTSDVVPVLRDGKFMKE